MKKITIGFMTALLIGSFAPIANAAEQTEVEYEVGSEYVLSIPSKVVLDNHGSTPLPIETDSHNLAPDKVVTVRLSDGLSSDGEITLRRFIDPTTTMTADVLVSDNPLQINHEYLAKFDYTMPQNAELSRLEIGIPQGETKAGTYTTTLTFSSEMSNKEIQ